MLKSEIFPTLKLKAQGVSKRKAGKQPKQPNLTTILKRYLTTRD
jgi:hypothetical protein